MGQLSETQINLRMILAHLRVLYCAFVGQLALVLMVAAHPVEPRHLPAPP